MLTFLTALQTTTSDFFDKMRQTADTCFSNFSFVDAIDILLLSLILFFLFRFIKGRKAGVLLIGVSILLIMMGIAYVVELDATYFVFDQIFKVGVIALIIIFQPEIREALERVGTGSINSIKNLGDQTKRNQMYQSVIEEVTTAVGLLSSSKTGAIIVIARTTKLDGLYTYGTRLDALVSSTLLRNIFQNKSPLHDGAVIIEDGRISIASCTLPNTKRDHIDSDLGTRHQAAIGMSENSDAIIIIVSEETGTISVAHESLFTRDYTVDTLKKYLSTQLIKNAHDSDEKKSK